MDKRELKKQILGQLAGYLRNSVIIDGLYGEDMDKCHAVQVELAQEFERRTKPSASRPEQKENTLL